MAESTETINCPQQSSARAVIRVGATIAVACTIAGSVMALGSAGVLTARGTTPTAVATPAATAIPKTAPKMSITASDVAAFRQSAYSADALNLAAIWSTDTRTAKAKAGSDLKAGTLLPFAPGKADAVPYTNAEKRYAFFDAGADFSNALGLAVVWQSKDVFTAKAKVGGMLLGHEPVPAAPTQFTSEQEAQAFTLVGYHEADAATLAGLWRTDRQSAKVRAGAKLLAGDQLPL